MNVSDVLLMLNYGVSFCFVFKKSNITLCNAPFHYYCRLMYVAMCNMNYTEESIDL